MKALIILFTLIYIFYCVSIFCVDHIFTLPIRGSFSISSGWYYQEQYGGGIHRAVDYSAIRGTQILAAYGGQVIQVVKNIPDETGANYGNYVLIDHGNGYKTRYAHMLCNSATVNVGEYVSQGQLIGSVGNTGLSTGPHLHFDCSYNGEPIDTYGWYSGNISSYIGGCNPDEYYFISNPPCGPILTQEQLQRQLPDDLLVHVIGTPNYYWLKDGQMKPFSCEYPFYTWGLNWNEAVEIDQSEFNSHSVGQTVQPMVGSCVYDQNSQRWVFDYQSNNSIVIVKRRATNWEVLQYSSDVWIPVSNAFMDQFAEGPELISATDYPYGTVMQIYGSPSVRYVLVRGAEISSQYAGQKVFVRLYSESVYNINYYHQNFNITVSQAVFDIYPLAPFSACRKIMDGKLVSGSGPQCYYIENGLKRLIVDSESFDAFGFNFANVHEVLDSDIDSFQSGEDIRFYSTGGSIDFQGGALEDGGFDSGSTGYWLFNDSQEVADFNITANDAVNGFFKAHIEINTPAMFFQEELMQLVKVDAGDLYHFSFRGKSNPSSEIKVCLQNHSSPWNNYGLWKEINLTSNWKKYQYIFQATQTDEMARLDFMLGENSGDKFFDQVIFEKIANIQTSGSNLIKNSDFELGHYAPFVVGDINSTAEYYTDESEYHGGHSSMYIDPNQNAEHWQVQLYQSVGVSFGQSYTLSFWAKAQSQRNVQLELYNENSPWNNFGLWDDLIIGTEWQNYSIQFTASDVGIARLSWNLGAEDIPIWIDDIVLSLGTECVDSEIIMSPVLSNYPNPFSYQTMMNFNLKEQSKVDLSIYNIKGQLVKTIVSSNLKSGYYEIIWDGRDSIGNICSSGIYIYTLKTKYGVINKKMIIKK